MVQALIDYLNAPQVVPLQRVVDNFDGDTLNERWTFADIVGTGSGAMNDAIDGGYRITTGTTGSDFSHIFFNNINHYSETGSAIHATVTSTSTTNSEQYVGLHEQNLTTNHRITYSNHSSFTFLQLFTSGTSPTLVDTTVARDTNPHNIFLELTSTSGIIKIDSVLEAISTTNLPTNELQPGFLMKTRTGAAKTGDISYLEAYNT